MHKPNITLACVVHCQDKFLFVEEWDNGILTLNQPAGHLEKDESLLAGMQRELWEETGIEHAQIERLVKIYQWSASRSKTDFLRFTFALELDDCCVITPHDSDITRGLWLTLAQFQDYIRQPGQGARSPLVLESIHDYLQAKTVPIDILKVFE
ncbi:NUDIX domain-containing protein [Testudinibacter aquarius]|uniref:NUDIX hydrolase n=1 Tax=Testudinibacter aquarius TaxID=1524974 RepID=A0A4R3YE01_9PAST|nr:NUDIX hydrolase [Testudinibacter aquarius]KAE9525734.1 NUDIX hydrolase [Testudinibacter aquarius]TCV88703.1 phosphatase NudJ [Testudinibacter aquarius]TNG92677.1 NUDIX hydrolase [Testudinibacter aquarius]